MNALTVTEPANADVEVGIKGLAQALAHTRARKTVLQRTPSVFFSLPLFS